MNILPLILALVLMLSVLTVERLEKFKNQTTVQREYQVFLQEGERQVFNQRQQKLYGLSQTSLRQLSFRFFIDKKARERDPDAAKQYRLLTIELMKNVYGEAAFFKKLKEHRPNFLEEMLNAIEQASADAPPKMIRRIQDVARLNLDDPELQEAFYRMMKGTISRDKLKNMKNLSPRMKEKAYVSLFTFMNYNGKSSTPKIMVQRAPSEILKAIFDNDEIVEAIISRRNELAASKDSGADTAFKNEFQNKCRSGIDDKLLDFRISASDKKIYN